MSRKPYPSDVSGLVCARVLRVAVGREAGPSAAVFDSLYPDKHILDS